MTALLSVQGLHKRFHDRVLFDIDALTIQHGAAYILTGMNGAGKSTLLRVLAGLEPAQARQVDFLGRPATLHPFPAHMRREIVYVHQHPALFSTSVERNIAYGLVQRKLAQRDIARQVDAAMEWAGVTHLRGTRPQHLSGGEKQRVALARAKVLAPALLLLDEPTANLDGAGREQVLALIPSLMANGGAVIVACHDRELIALPSVHRMKLSDGQLELRS